MVFKWFTQTQKRHVDWSQCPGQWKPYRIRLHIPTFGSQSSGSTKHMLLLGAPHMIIPVCPLSALSVPTPSAAWQHLVQAFTGIARYSPAAQLLRSKKRNRSISQSLQLLVHRADIGVSASSTGGTSGTPQSPWWYLSLQPPEPCALPPLPLLFRLSECDIAVILISGRSADALRRFFST